MSEAPFSESRELRLQRLVDGELPESQLTPLLEELDRDNAWRDCALAFVEAQIWSACLKSSMESKGEHRAVAPSRQHTEAPARHERWSSLGWLAVCLVLAFALGRQTARPGAARPGDAPRTVRDVVPSRDEPHVASSLESNELLPAVSPHDLYVTTVGPANADLGPTLGEVTLRVEDREGPRVLTLPVFATSDAHRERFSRPAIPAALEAKLQAAGRQVQHTVSYAPVRVGAEQVMYVPVESLQLVPASRVIP